MGQIQLTIGLVLIGLFTIALIGFVLNFGIDNDSPINLADDPEIVGLYARTTGNISDFSDDSEDQYESIVESTIDPGSSVAPSMGAFAITPLNSLGVVKNILKVGYIKIFGTGAGFGIFITALISIIVFMFGLFLYKTLRGNPD